MNNSMNDKLRNYSVQPDAEVWGKIEKTLRRRTLVRRGAAVATGVVAVAAVVVALTINRESTSLTASSTAKAMPDVAQATTGAASVQPIASETATMQPATTAQVLPTQATPPQQTNNTVATPTLRPDTVKPAANMPTTVQPATTVKPAGKEYAEIIPPAIIAPAAPSVTTFEREEAADQGADKTETFAESHRNEAKSTYNSPLDDTILWIPNAFAPNADNPDIRTFRVRLSQPGNSISNYRIVIFNRGGQQVFQSDDINRQWDGTFKGRPLPQSAYIYIINYTDSDQVRHQCRGTVTLIR